MSPRDASEMTLPAFKPRVSRGAGPYGRGTTPYDPTLRPLACPGPRPDDDGDPVTDYTVGGHEKLEARVYKASEFPPLRGSVLRKAEQAVHGPRRGTYGPPEVNHGRTAALWQAYLDSRPPGALNAEDVCWLNLLQKCSREMHSETEDGLVDAAGYVENIALIRVNSKD